MSQLFAAHCLQNVVPAPITGQYDAERELWVSDNQLQGSDLKAAYTVYDTGTSGATSYMIKTWHATSGGSDIAAYDTAPVHDKEPDTDQASDGY